MNNKIWVVVANGSLARIFRPEDAHKLVEIETIQHPQTRLHGRDLVTDKPGSGFASVGNRRSSKEPGMLPQKNEAYHFAEKLSQHLDHAHRSGDVKKLYLIAGPSFLGLMRSSLHEITQGSIALAIDKDITDKDPSEIRQYLPSVL